MKKEQNYASRSHKVLDFAHPQQEYMRIFDSTKSIAETGFLNVSVQDIRKTDVNAQFQNWMNIKIPGS